MNDLEYAIKIFTDKDSLLFNELVKSRIHSNKDFRQYLCFYSYLSRSGIDAFPLSLLQVKKNLTDQEKFLLFLLQKSYLHPDAQMKKFDTKQEQKRELLALVDACFNEELLSDYLKLAKRLHFYDVSQVITRKLSALSE